MLLLSLRCELAATRVYFGGTGTRATATNGTAREQQRGPVADNPTLSSSTECRKDLGRVKHLTYTPRCWSQAREATSDSAKTKDDVVGNLGALSQLPRGGDHATGIATTAARDTLAHAPARIRRSLRRGRSLRAPSPRRSLRELALRPSWHWATAASADSSGL
ncbi:hypothetical protein PCL_01089 [Purpureocillium lilacinum]|uniref:Uncharacterized protein n=1 Tax=Purpureocillium lilacinum TaxID=33203 RepID=A0A2U3E4L7_PURLI|nr:hypothetical protein Purlil1_9768 [Purpureocillium lilacinum]PWI69442.1 hypothetical protein PCL_01089 [Purpureocillium lilacinum]